MPEITEKAFQQQVLDLASLYGWRAYHTFDSRRSAAGFPDVVLVRPPRLIFAELKTATGRVSGAQQAWLDDLGAVVRAAARRGDIEVHVWRPDDLQAIAETLATTGPARRPTGVQAVTPPAIHRSTAGRHAA